ncbi:MAG: EamA family transporter [Halanaerobiales bacterium]|nr:EamA family transporter [Halanaerobiales bacterium]
MILKELKGYLLIIIAMLIWGSVGIFARWTGESSSVIVFYRVIITFIILVILWIVKGCKGLSDLRTNWKLVVLSGLALGLNWYFFFTAIQRTTVANAVLSYYVAPIIVTILSPVLLKEKIERSSIVALVFGFLGVVVMMAGPGNKLGAEDLLGIGAGLLAAFFYAILTILGKKIQLSARLLVMIQTGVASILFFPQVLGQLIVSSKSLIMLLIIGIIHTAFALTIYYEGIKMIKVQHVGVLGYLDPLSAILFAFFLLGEIPGFSSLLGGILIIFSSFLILSRKKSIKV